MKYVFSSFLFMFFLITCSSSNQNIRAVCKNNNIKLRHSITYSQKGTRSEAQHGFISINTKIIPDVFILAQTSEIVYKFYQRTNMWGRDGYFPEKNVNIYSDTGQAQSIKKITSEALNIGWYRGSEKLNGTPERWLFVKWEHGSAFVSPTKIKQMIIAFNLKDIPRKKSMPIMYKNR